MKYSIATLVDLFFASFGRGDVEFDTALYTLAEDLGRDVEETYKEAWERYQAVCNDIEHDRDLIMQVDEIINPALPLLGRRAWDFEVFNITRIVQINADTTDWSFYGFSLN